MSSTRSKNEPIARNQLTVQSATLKRSSAKSSGTTVVNVATILIGAECTAPIGDVCLCCDNRPDPQTSSAENPNIFCSEDCEQEFIRAALADITLEDCICIHRRLERLLQSVQQPVLQ